jgi:hypothetical protein
MKNTKSAGEFLRFDAAKVGIVIGRKGKEQNGGVLDFHSLRHFYGTVCDQAGISDGLRRKLHRAQSKDGPHRDGAPEDCRSLFRSLENRLSDASAGHLGACVCGSKQVLDVLGVPAVLDHVLHRCDQAA